mmetsp:Transcript_30404/g.76192  ORF Transcript_30404/g.76192 Transcript_30404/m.76192 type:complete len:205 (-) Transcript_30404:1825-2439(-)
MTRWHLLAMCCPASQKAARTCLPGCRRESVTSCCPPPTLERKERWRRSRGTTAARCRCRRSDSRNCQTRRQRSVLSCDTYRRQQQPRTREKRRPAQARIRAQKRRRVPGGKWFESQLREQRQRPPQRRKRMRRMWTEWIFRMSVRAHAARVCVYHASTAWRMRWRSTRLPDGTSSWNGLHALARRGDRCCGRSMRRARRWEHGC